jgi:hypothetical protein
MSHSSPTLVAVQAVEAQGFQDNRTRTILGRDVNAAKSFLRSAMKNTRVPTKITLDALCGLAPGGARDEGRRRTSGSRPGSIQPVLEQSGRAGPSESEATNSAVETPRIHGNSRIWRQLRDRTAGTRQFWLQLGHTPRCAFHRTWLPKGTL